MKLRLIALGQRLAGDDGAGMAIYDEIAKQSHPYIDLKTATDASSLLDLLLTPMPVLVVDALVGAETSSEPGRIHSLTLEQIATRRITTVSTHGLDILSAAALARELFPESVSPSIQLLGIEIEKAELFSEQISPPVAAAVKEALHKIDEIAKQFQKT